MSRIISSITLHTNTFLTKNSSQKYNSNYWMVTSIQDSDNTSGVLRTHSSQSPYSDGYGLWILEFKFVIEESHRWVNGHISSRCGWHFVRDFAFAPKFWSCKIAYLSRIARFRRHKLGWILFSLYELQPLESDMFEFILHWDSVLISDGFYLRGGHWSGFDLNGQIAGYDDKIRF